MFAETEFDKRLVEMLRTTEAPGQYAARNAVRHLDKAAAIAATDPDMAAFRAITAEEESATAVFHSLKRHKYPGSEALKPRDHLHKNALNPFCLAVAELFAKVDANFALRPQLFIDESEPVARLVTQFHVAGLGLGDRIATPRPPLNLAIGKNGKLHDFGDQLEALATGRRVDSIKAHLKQRANMRNEILYASATGLPSVTLNRFIEEQSRAVKVNLELFLLIEPYSEHQLFVSQTLRAFLKMLGVLPADLEF